MSELIKLSNDLKKAHNISKSIARRLYFDTVECPTVNDAISQFSENRINAVKNVLDDSIKILNPSEELKTGINRSFISIAKMVKKLLEPEGMNSEEVSLTAEQKEMLKQHFSVMQKKVDLMAGLLMVRINELELTHLLTADILQFLTECQEKYLAHIHESQMLDDLHANLPDGMTDQIFKSTEEYEEFLLEERRKAKITDSLVKGTQPIISSNPTDVERG